MQSIFQWQLPCMESAEGLLGHRQRRWWLVDTSPFCVLLTAAQDQSPDEDMVVINRLLESLPLPDKLAEDFQPLHQNEFEKVRAGIACKRTERSVDCYTVYAYVQLFCQMLLSF